MTLGTRRSPPWLFGNASAGGFYRVFHQPSDHRALVGDLGAALSPVERLALVGDQWALVRAARAKIEGFLDVADGLGGETDYDVLDGLAGPLGVLDDQIVEGDLQRWLRSWITDLFGSQLRTLGWTAQPDEDDRQRLRRAALLRLVGSIAEAADVVEEASARLDGYLADRSSLEPNLADAVVSISARQGDEGLYERYRELTASAPTPQERRRFLLNLASFRAPSLVERTLQATLEAEVPDPGRYLHLYAPLRKPERKRGGVAILLAQLEAAAHAHSSADGLAARGIDAVAARPALRSRGGQVLPPSPDPRGDPLAKQALEMFRLNAELRRRIVPGIARWAKRKAPKPDRARRASLALDDADRPQLRDLAG